MIPSLSPSDDDGTRLDNDSFADGLIDACVGSPTGVSPVGAMLGALAACASRVPRGLAAGVRRKGGLAFEARDSRRFKLSGALVPDDRGFRVELAFAGTRLTLDIEPRGGGYEGRFAVVDADPDEAVAALAVLAREWPNIARRASASPYLNPLPVGEGSAPRAGV